MLFIHALQDITTNVHDAVYVTFLVEYLLKFHSNAPCGVPDDRSSLVQVTDWCH